MAKTEPTVTPQADPIVVSTRTQRLIDGVAPTFRAFAKDFSAINESRAALAPRFMKACLAWQAETTGTFVAFVRYLDPTVPEAQKDYRANAVYAAADYLRRLVGRQDAAGARQHVRAGEEPATPLTALSRVVAAILPLFGDDTLLWQALTAELHWSDAQVSRLRSLAKDADPLLETHVPKSGRGIRPVLTYDADEPLAKTA